MLGYSEFWISHFTRATPNFLNAEPVLILYIHYAPTNLANAPLYLILEKVQRVLFKLCQIWTYCIV